MTYSPERIKARVGRNIAYLRNQDGITQEELARRLGLTFNYISLVENGHRGIGVDNLVKVANVFGISPGRFLDEDLSSRL